MIYSFNNRLIVEEYVKEALKAKFQGGIAIPGQRDGLKGLKVLVDFKFPDGSLIPKNSTVYVREETLHSHPWASKPLNGGPVPGKFLILESQYIEMVETPENQA